MISVKARSRDYLTNESTIERWSSQWRQDSKM